MKNRSSCFQMSSVHHPRFHMSIDQHVNTQALYTSSLVLFLSPSATTHDVFRAEKAPVCFFSSVKAILSSSETEAVNGAAQVGQFVNNLQTSYRRYIGKAQCTL